MMAWLAELLHWLFPPPYLVMGQVRAVLRERETLTTLDMLDAIEEDYGKAPSLGKLYLALHILERDGLVASRWIEEGSLKEVEFRRKYYWLVHTIPWSQVKKELELN